MITTATIWVNTTIDKALEKRVRILAAHKGVSKSELLRQALAKYLESEEKGVKDAKQSTSINT